MLKESSPIARLRFCPLIGMGPVRSNAQRQPISGGLAVPEESSVDDFKPDLMKLLRDRSRRDCLRATRYRCDGSPRLTESK